MLSLKSLLGTTLSLLLTLGAGCAALPPAAPQATPIPVPEGYQLLWHDEFDGSKIDPASWTYDLGAGGWGNAELEAYTSRAENARLENGMLVIEARKEAYQGAEYTSARLKTQGLREFKYGRAEARLQVPAGQGLWPAFWMLGNDIDSNPWPQCGEVDIMEYIGKEPKAIFGTLHGPGYSGAQGISNALRPADAIASSLHIFAVEWTPDAISWFFDGAQYHQVKRADLGGKTWVFDHPFFIILNLAVGGQWPGNPNAETSFPAQLRVDYVRVFSKQ